MLTTEIKSWLKNTGVGVVKNGCSHPGNMVNGWTKLRITLIVFEVVEVKNVYWTLISEWMDESS